MSVPTDLEPFMIAKIMLHMYSIKNINCAGKGTDESYDILGIYQEDGPDKGIYISREKEIENKISEFNVGRRIEGDINGKLFFQPFSH